MGKYKNHEEFGGQAPVNYREDTTSESYLKGMSSIAPPGMKPKVIRGQRFEEKTDFKASALWHKNYDQAMFGGSDIGSPNYLNLQRILEGRPGEARKAPGR
jgi:hypothetical protein